MENNINNNESKINSTKVRLIEVLEKNKYKQIDISKEINIDNSVISLWLQDRLTEDKNKIEKLIDNWLKELYTNKNNNNFSNSKYNNHDNDLNSNNILNNNYIPIKIIYQNDISDTILWNINEENITPANFAKIYAEDMGIPSNYESEIENIIIKSINNHKKIEKIDLKLEANAKRSGNLLKSLENEELNKLNILKIPKNEKICLITINIKYSGIEIFDQFEWDVLDFTSDPKEIAENICFEHGFNDQIKKMIETQITEQVYLFRRVGEERVDNRFKRHKKEEEDLITRCRVDKIDSTNILKPKYETDYYAVKANYNWDEINI